MGALTCRKLINLFAQKECACGRAIARNSQCSTTVGGLPDYSLKSLFDMKTRISNFSSAQLACKLPKPLCLRINFELFLKPTELFDVTFLSFFTCRHIKLAAFSYFSTIQHR